MNDISAHQERASLPSPDNCQGIVSSLCSFVLLYAVQVYGYAYWELYMCIWAGC